MRNVRFQGTWCEEKLSQTDSRFDWWCVLPTIVCDVGDLKAAGAVCLVGLEVNPEASGASCEGDRSLVRLARLIGGDGCGGPLQEHEKRRY